MSRVVGGGVEGVVSTTIAGISFKGIKQWILSIEKRSHLGVAFCPYVTVVYGPRSAGGGISFSATIELDPS
jgi:hypothetical protein